MKLKILAVDNEERLCKLIKTSLELEGHQVEMVFSGSGALEKLEAESYDVVVTDLKMAGVGGLDVLRAARKIQPDCEVIIITAFATQETALQAMKEGAYDYLIKPFKMDELSLRLQRIGRQKELEEENRRLKKLARQAPPSFPGIVGKSQRMREVFQKIAQVCRSDTAVHIRGESGTGKELVARAIHENSLRKSGPFIAINCAALPETLLESELFGYEKGAFTGADKRKPGLFESAQGGTVFLDEIGDMPYNLQAKLLRVLQSNEISRLGGHERIRVDFRLITATHSDLEEMIEQQKFRSDLYYRINIFPIYLPPLRERKEDIPELVQHFMNKYPDKSLAARVRLQLMEYDYPGNVRELENLITRAALLSDQIIEQVDLPRRATGLEEAAQNPFCLPDEGINIDELERTLIKQALEKASGNKSRAAKLLGITRRRLYSMMQRFNVEL